MPRFGITRLLCLMLLTGAFLVLGNDRSEADVGLASWYCPEFEGYQTASGETYDPNGYTAAHNSLPLGTGLVVSYGERSVPVRVNERGPFLGTRLLDLSQAAARDLGPTREGVGYVEYEVLKLDFSHLQAKGLEMRSSPQYAPLALFEVPISSSYRP